jgi:hypothetical protein
MPVPNLLDLRWAIKVMATVTVTVTVTAADFYCANRNIEKHLFR